MGALSNISTPGSMDKEIEANADASKRLDAVVLTREDYMKAKSAARSR